MSQQCPHDGGVCHHACEATCLRKARGMALSTPHPGFPVPTDAPLPQLPEGLKLTDLAEALGDGIMIRFSGKGEGSGAPLLRMFPVDEAYARLLVAALQAALERLRRRRAETSP